MFGVHNDLYDVRVDILSHRVVCVWCGLHFGCVCVRVTLTLTRMCGLYFGCVCGLHFGSQYRGIGVGSGSRCYQHRSRTGGNGGP